MHNSPDGQPSITRDREVALRCPSCAETLTIDAAQHQRNLIRSRATSEPTCPGCRSVAWHALTVVVSQ